MTLIVGVLVVDAASMDAATTEVIEASTDASGE